MRIRYFAWIKDITNKDDDIIDINHPKTIQELKKYLENLYPELKKHFLERLTAAEIFEKYLHTRYVGQKRFSLEGGESLIVALDQMLQRTGASGVEEVP